MYIKFWSPRVTPTSYATEDNVTFVTSRYVDFKIFAYLLRSSTVINMLAD